MSAEADERREAPPSGDFNRWLKWLPLLAFCALLATALPGQATAASAIALVPQPVRVTVTGGAFTLGPKAVLAVTPEAGVRPIAEMLAQRLRVATGYALPVATVPGRRPAILLTTAHADPALGSEGYALTATPAGVVIRAPQPAGLFYGTQTLRQLLPSAIESRTRVSGVAWRVPGMRVWDRPCFPVRGLMIDSARHLQSVAFLKRTLDRMAYHKLNTFHWHLTDDQGWRLEIRRFPRLTQIGAWRLENGHRYGGFYTQAQVRDIVAYAAARFITVVPELDMPAHSNAALASYPALGCVPGPFHVLDIGEPTGHVLDPGKPFTYDFVDGVLSEVMALFPAPVIHIGGDECPKDEWRAAPECRALMREMRLPSEDALQNYFTRRVAAFLAAHGRRLQGWNEILQGGPLPPDVVIQQWNEPRAATVAAHAGHDVMASPTGFVYFDAPNDAIPLQRVYSLDPMPAGLTPAEARHIRGVEACLWTEGKPTDAVCDEFLWPRITALAEVAWSPAAARDWPGFRRRLLDAHLERLALMGLGAVTPAGTPAEVRQALVDRGELDWGTQVGTWQPAHMSETWEAVDWDVTPNIHGAGAYTLRLNYEAGADGIAVGSVELRQDGRPVAQDAHAGWAGAAPRDRLYHLSLPAYDPAAHYVLHIRLRSDGGTDSHGGLWLAGP